MSESLGVIILAPGEESDFGLFPDSNSARRASSSSIRACAVQVSERLGQALLATFSRFLGPFSLLGVPESMELVLKRLVRVDTLQGVVRNRLRLFGQIALKRFAEARHLARVGRLAAIEAASLFIYRSTARWGRRHSPA